MSRLQEFLGRVSRLTRSRPRDRELDEELLFHVEEQMDAAMRRGLSAEDARRAAIASLGAPTTLVKEEIHDAWGMALIDDIRRDLRIGARLLKRQPLSTAVIVATLSCAIGTTVATFSLVDSWLLRPLSFPNADRIVVGLAATPQRPTEPAIFLLFRDFVALRDQAQACQNLSGAFRRSHLVTDAGGSTESIGMAVTPEFFRTLGVNAQFGRTLDTSDVGAPRVVVSNGFWQQQLGASPSIIGTSIILDGMPHEVVGVMPRDFDVRLLDQTKPFELWTLLDATDRAYAPGGAGPVALFARLRDGVDIQAAQHEAEAIVQAVEIQHTEGISRFRVLLTS